MDFLVEITIILFIDFICGIEIRNHHYASLTDVREFFKPKEVFIYFFDVFLIFSGVEILFELILLFSLRLDHSTFLPMVGFKLLLVFVYTIMTVINLDKFYLPSFPEESSFKQMTLGEVVEGFKVTAVTKKGFPIKYKDLETGKELFTTLGSALVKEGKHQIYYLEETDQ